MSTAVLNDITKPFVSLVEEYSSEWLGLELTPLYTAAVVLVRSIATRQAAGASAEALADDRRALRGVVDQMVDALYPKTPYMKQFYVPKGKEPFRVDLSVLLTSERESALARCRAGA